MTRTTDDSGELLGKMIDNKIEEAAVRDLKESADQTGEAAEKGTGTGPADETGEKPDGAPGALSASDETDEGKPESESEPEKGDEEAEGGSEPEEGDEEPEGGSEPEDEDDEPEGGSEPEDEDDEPEGGSEPEDEDKAPAAAVKKPKKAGKSRKKQADEDDDDPEEDDSEEGGMGLNLFTFLVLLIAATITIVYYTCTVKTVKVTGNHLYTSEEIAEQVISDDTQLRHNTVFLTALYMTPMAPRIPFEESVKVSLESYDTIRITVKDMDIAGFIPYGGKNLYFSADGIVLENSPLLVKNATFVTGLSVTGAETGQKMTSDDEAGLAMILETLQILRKYQMEVESVVLSDSSGIILYMDEIKVYLGRSNFELKISKIAQILPYLDGRSGTIDLTNYTSADQNIILK